MKRILYTLFLLFLLAEQTFAQLENSVTLSVMKEEREEYQNEVQHFITHTYYGMLEEAISTSEVHSSFISYLMQEDAVKYMPEFVSDYADKRYMSPTQYFGCLYRAFSGYNPDELHFSINDIQVDDNFYAYGLRGCYIRTEYDLEIKYQDKVISSKRCRMYCLFPNKSSKKIIKVMQLEPVKDLYVRSEVQKKDISVKNDSFETLLKRAKRGDSDAQFEVGSKYFTGDGVGKNYTEAVKWYHKSAEQGQPAGQNYLGYCYSKGLGVPQDYREAVKWYRKSAEQGHPSGQNNLGFCYQEGWGVPKDQREAVKWFRLAATQGCASAQYSLGYCYEFNQGVTQDYREAVKWYRKSAEQGDHHAQYRLGRCFENDWGVDQKDYLEAVKWYRRSAENGHAIAQNDLGVCYYNGNGVKQNYAEAVKWFRKAAEQGNASAQSNLGICYQEGLGVPQDFQEAVKWYRKAAEQGDAGGQYNLGAFYFFAQGVLQDYNEAVKWLRKSAEMGYADAQILLGNCYEKGLGIPQDYREAVKWYRKSAEQGNSVGQLKLADCYYYGRGFTQDYQEAVKLYRMAAEHGHSYAQYRLGYAHYKGIGIPRNFKEAKKWLSLAADQGHDTAKSLLDELNSQTSLDIKRKNDVQSNDTHEWIKVSFDTPLLFREGSALLQKPIEVNAQLQRLNTKVISMSQSHVRIVGHISQKEAEAGKHSLALQRAKNIESILKKHGNVRHCEVKAADESDSFHNAEVVIYMYVSKEALKKAQ